MMQQRSDTAQFHFISSGCDSDSFHVSEFEGTEEISQPYCFELSLISARSDLPIEEVTGSNATLFIYRNGEYHPWSGVVANFSFVETTIEFSRYRLTLMPHLWLLTLSKRSRIFQRQPVTDIIKNVLDENGLLNHYTIDCGNHPEREFVMQYDESDFNFICRLMEEEGIWYLFSEDPVARVESVGEEHLLITDRPASFREIPSPNQIPYHSESGTVAGDVNENREYISSLSLGNRLIPADLALHNYNYRTPEIDLSVSRTVTNGTTGTVHRFGGSCRDVSQLQETAIIEQRRLTASRLQINGGGNCRAFRAGYTFESTDAPRDEFNTTLCLKKVSHSGKQIENVESDYKKISYKNIFSAITSDTMQEFSPPLRTPVPKINGVFTAAIEGMGSEYAYLDDQGRYHIRIPFDTAEAENGQATKPIRLSQPYSGSDYGIHFPSHEDTEMIVGCIDGDPNKPIGLGTVPNANTLSPVRSTNKHTSVIRTAGNNEIILDDLDGKQKISIKTNADNHLIFDDELEKITLQSTAENRVVVDDENKKVTINAQENVITLSYEDSGNKITVVTGDGHSLTFDDENRRIELKSKDGHIVRLDDEDKTMTLTDERGTNTVTLDREAGISMETQMDINIRAEGDLNIEAANMTVQSRGDAEVTADSNMNITASNDMTLVGVNVDINASSNATINASAQLEATGATATFEASGMGELKAGGVLTVQGGMVNIN